MKRLRAPCVIAGTALAVVAFPDKVDDIVRAELGKQKIPGAAVAIMREGKVLKAQGYGLANLELQVPVKPETVFQIQSVTKQFTATAIMMLVEEGKVGLDDEVSKYLDDVPTTWKGITVRRLLSHTSGIKDFINEPTTDLRLEMSDADVFKATAPRPLNFQPGERYSYSNTNYSMLSLIIRKVTGEWYGDFIRDRIFKPLGMKDTRIYSWTDIIPNRASGYLLRDGKWINGMFIAESVLGYPGGGICSTVVDMAKWDAALYTEKLLKADSLKQMWTSATLTDGRAAGYGFGWAIGQINGHKLISHGGAHMTGFRSTIMRFVDDKLTVVVLTNSGACDPDRIGQAVAAVYVPALAKQVPKAIADKEPQVTAFLKKVLEDAAAGKFDPSVLAPGMEKLLTPEAVRQGAAQLRALGKLQKIELLRRANQAETRLYSYRITFENGVISCGLGLTKDDKIAAIQIGPG